MQEGLKKFFTRDNTLYLMPVFFIIFEIASEVMYAINGWFDNVYTIERVALAACMVGIAIAYKKHEKNVMKPLLGAVLLGIFFSDLPYVADMFENHDYYVGATGGIWFVYEIMVVIVLAGYVVIFISHLGINSDHHSNPGKIKFNQAVIILTLLTYLVQVIVSLLIGRTALFMGAKICSFLANAALLNMVVCVESKLDMFRLQREERGWSEEK